MARPHNEQHFNRLERRIDVLDAGLTALRAELATSTEQIIQAITAKPK